MYSSCRISIALFVEIIIVVLADSISLRKSRHDGDESSLELRDKTLRKGKNFKNLGGYNEQKKYKKHAEITLGTFEFGRQFCLRRVGRTGAK